PRPGPRGRSRPQLEPGRSATLIRSGFPRVGGNMHRTFKDIMDEARKVVPEVTVDQVKQRLAGNGHAVHVIDVREKEEYREGHLPGAVSVPRGFLEMKIEETVPDRDAEIIAYCQGGTRS